MVIFPPRNTEDIYAGHRSGEQGDAPEAKKVVDLPPRRR